MGGSCASDRRADLFLEVFSSHRNGYWTCSSQRIIEMISTKMADSQHVGGLVVRSFSFKRKKERKMFEKKQVGGVGGVEQCSEWRQLAVGGFFGWPRVANLCHQSLRQCRTVAARLALLE